MCLLILCSLSQCFRRYPSILRKPEKVSLLPERIEYSKGILIKILRRSFDGYSPYLSFTPILDGAYALCLVSVEHKATKMGKVGEGFV